MNASSDEDLKVLTDLWIADNRMLNIKLAQYLAITSLLFVAFQAYHDYRLIICIFGMVLSIAWIYSIGRTTAFRTHWKKKIKSRAPELFPTDVPWYAAWSSVFSALLLPGIGVFFWLVILVRLVKP